MRRLPAALPLLAMLLAPLAIPTAEARSQTDMLWPLSTVYPIAVRFVRIDRGCDILDKDPQSAYIVFACPDDTPRAKEPKDREPPPMKRGTLEFIAVDPTASKVRVQATLADEPRYMEMRFLELLERKIKDERGPAPPPRHSPPSDGPDGGAR
jgi:hypothetical protein